MAELKTAWCPDIDELADYRPPIAAPFSVFVQLLVGPRGDPGEESFNLTVCNGAWLSQQASENGPIIGRHYLIVNEWNWNDLTEFLRSQVNSCTGESWQEIAVQLARLGHWEFEDYQP